MNRVSRIGLDTAKDVFQVHAVDAGGEVVTMRRLRRRQVLDWFARLERVEECLVGLEATGGSHYWARELRSLGYRVRLLNPQAVKPYRHGQKTDARDAAAICEAAGRRAVAEAPVKSAAQQAVLAQQAYRRRLVNQRTALANQLRGLLGEFGVTLGRGLTTLRRRLPALIEDADHALPEAQARGDERCRRLMAQPGIGPLSALRLVAICDDGAPWRNGRAFATSQGLTPGQHSSGEQSRIGPITRRGDAELRTLLIHGARSALARLDERTPLGRWALGLQRRRHKNVAAVALAHKNARIAWALLAHGREYEPATDTGAA